MTINLNTGSLIGPYGSNGTISPFNPNTFNVTFWGDVIGWDFWSNTNKSFQSFPNMDHGTHVAGIVRAVVGNSSIVPNVTLLPLRIGPDYDYPINISATGGLSSIIYAVNRGARIINCSWGSPETNGFNNLSNTVVNYATDGGSIVIAAAGNNNSNALMYPAASPNAIAVAASDGNNKTATSNFGNWIDIIAPGANVRSSSYNSSGNDNYVNYTGTSMAAPIVSGVAAAMLTVNPLLTPQQIKAILTDPANTDRYGLYTGMPNAGRINAFKAVQNSAIEVITTVRTISNPAELTNKHFLVTNGGRLVVNVGNALINSPYGSFTIDGAGSQMYFENCTNQDNRIGNVTVKNGGLFSLYDNNKINIVDGVITVIGPDNLSGPDTIFQSWNNNELTLIRTQVFVSNSSAFTTNNNSTLHLLDNSTIYLDNFSLLRTNIVSNFFMKDSTIEINGRSEVKFLEDSRFETWNHNYIYGNVPGTWNTNVTPSTIITWGDRMIFNKSLILNHQEITIASRSGQLWDGLIFNDTHSSLTPINSRPRILTANISGIRYIRLENSELDIANCEIRNIRQIVSFADTHLRVLHTLYENNQLGIFVEHGRLIFFGNSTIRNNGSSGVTIRFTTQASRTMTRALVYNNLGDGINLNTSTFSVALSEIRNNARDGISIVGSLSSIIEESTYISNNNTADIYAPATSFPQFIGYSMVGTSPASASISRAFLWATGINNPPPTYVINLGDLRISVGDPQKFYPSINNYQINFPLRNFDRELYLTGLNFMLEESYDEALTFLKELLFIAPESEYSQKAVTYLPVLYRELGIDIKELMYYFETLLHYDNLRDIVFESSALARMFNNDFRESVMLFHNLFSSKPNEEKELLYELYQAYSYFRLAEKEEKDLPEFSRYKPMDRIEFEMIYSNIMNQLRAGVDDKIESQIPETTTISSSNYPNPFNPSTMISFDVPKEANVKIAIYIIKGQKVRNLYEDFHTIGSYNVEWNGTDDIGRNVASGVYFYKIQIGEIESVNRMLLMK